MVTRLLAFAAQKWFESSGVGSWQMREESREFVEGWEFSSPGSPAVKRRLYVCCSYSETVINPLPGYD
jgi:hypothetical protein